jgi:tRNA pseudouridine55 synthase
MFALLNLNKPIGITSRDAVNRVQRLVRPHKVGHAGTLDPIAKGVLILCLGPATRLISHVQQMPKTYRGTFRLGCRSESADSESEVHKLVDAPVPTADQLEQALPAFRGTIEQIPPAYSAVKINGQRAYKLAREGVQVDMPSRKVEIYRLDVVKYDYPQLELLIECGSGTYVRSLGRDLAVALGTGAIMTALTRTAIGPFRLEDALDADQLSSGILDDALIPAAQAVIQLPQRTLTPVEQEELANGRFIEAFPTDAAHEEIAGLDRAGKLLAILGSRGEGKLGTRLNFIAKN